MKLGTLKLVKEAQKELGYNVVYQVTEDTCLTWYGISSVEALRAIIKEYRIPVDRILSLPNDWKVCIVPAKKTGKAQKK